MKNLKKYSGSDCDSNLFIPVLRTPHLPTLLSGRYDEISTLSGYLYFLFNLEGVSSFSSVQRQQKLK